MEYIGNELEIFRNAKNWKKYYAKNIKPFIKGDVLEVGAGLGINTEFMINSEVLTWDYVEPDPRLAASISSNGVSKSISRNIIVGTIDNVDPSTKYDSIVYIDVLEHIEQSKAEIIKIKAALKTGGYLVVLVPAYNFLFNEFDEKVGHFRRYTKVILKNEVNNELVQKKLFYLDSLGFFASLVNKLFLHKSLPSLKNILFWDKVIIPLSKISDVLFFRSFGKSLIGVYQKK